MAALRSGKVKDVASIRLVRRAIWTDHRLIETFDPGRLKTRILIQSYMGFVGSLGSLIDMFDLWEADVLAGRQPERGTLADVVSENVANFHRVVGTAMNNFKVALELVDGPYSEEGQPAS